MDTEKYFWKSIYYFIKYHNYHIVNIDKNDSEIWLIHKKKNKLVIFRKISLRTKKFSLIKLKCWIIINNMRMTSILN